MSEWEQLLLTLESKSKATIMNYKSAYKKLHRMVDSDFADLTEEELCKGIQTNENPNSQQATCNIAILVFKMLGLSVDKLVELRENNKPRLKALVKAKNGSLCVSLPSYNQLIGHLDGLYEASKFQEYIICYLLINLNVRNKDLNLKFVSKKSDMNDDKLNYLWYSVKKKNVTYVRNSYKTVSTYGQKENVITNEFFINAVKKYMLQIKHESSNLLIPNEEQLAYFIQKSTYDQIGSSNYMKVCINYFRDNLNKITEISENRGTDIATILSNYDIVNQ